MYCLVPPNVAVVSLLIGIQNWGVIFEAMWESVQGLVQAPAMRDAIKRVVAGAAVKGPSNEVAALVIEWVHVQRWRSLNQSSMCGTTVTLIDWPGVDTLLHLSAVHRRWRTLGKVIDQIKLQFELGNIDEQARCCSLLMRENTDGKTLVGLLLEESNVDSELEAVWRKLWELPTPLRGYTIPRWLVAIRHDDSWHQWPVAILRDLLGEAETRPEGYEGFSLVPGKQYALKTDSGIVHLDSKELQPEEGMIIGGFLRGSQQMTKLSIRNNNLQDDGIDAIVVAVSENASSGLRFLDVAANNLTSDGAKAIADRLPKMRKLTFLDVAGNNIEDVGMWSIGNVLLHAPGLSKLGYVICDAFDLGDKVETLDLVNRRFNVWQSTLLGGALKFNWTLLTLNLEKNKVGDDGVEALAAGISANASSVLQTLDLSNNCIGPEGARHLAEMIWAVAGRATLRNLILKDNQLCGVPQHGRGMYTAKGVKALCESLANPESSVTKLDICNNKLSGDWPYKQAGAAQALADALRLSPIIDLRTSHNDLGDAGVSLVCKVVRERSMLMRDAVAAATEGAPEVEVAPLRILALDNNRVGPKGAHAIAEMLGCCHIVELDARGNGIADWQAAIDLANAVVAYEGLEIFSSIPISEIRQDKLKKLDLSDRNLGPVEGVVLANLVGKATNLTHLHVANNELGNRGVGAVAVATQANPTSKLEHIDVGFNKVGGHGALKMKELVEKVKVRNIFTLNIAGNYLDHDTKDALHAVAQSGESASGLKVLL